ncbi:hypothetical protein PG993_000061 [Apiospora rasikravindrae]|uniref:Uncharacterized protein n=1 Tax=Apiospora rasikravindrae TaxID=990691 RepID=A0ABR1U7H7_9PEZI
MPSYLHTIAAASIDEDVAEAGKCCNVRCLTSLHLFQNGTRHHAVAETKPESTSRGSSEKFSDSEVSTLLVEKGAGRDCLRLFFIVSIDDKNDYKHGHGLARCLRALLETAGLPSRFVIDLCKGEHWTIIPTTLSSVSASSSNSIADSLVFQYGFYGWAEKASPSFVLQVITDQKTTSFYCLNFPEALTDLINRHVGSNPSLGQKPMFINILILDFALRSYQRGIRGQRDRLRHIPHLIDDATIQEQGNSKEDVKKQAETLHDLSVQWHCMLKDLEDIRQHIESMLALQKRVEAMSKTKASPQVVHGDDDATTATDDLRNLEAVRGFWARWANTYLERTNIRIQLLHHLANQQIAIQTQRESMAMFTLALVTVLFLPGTFVASILSTSFFNYDGTAYAVSDNIAPVLVPSLIGATLLILLSWFAWYQWRLYRLNRKATGSDEQE